MKLISLHIYLTVPAVLIVDSMMQLSSNPRIYEFGLLTYFLHIQFTSIFANWLFSFLFNQKIFPQESSIFIINIST